MMYAYYSEIEYQDDEPCSQCGSTDAECPCVLRAEISDQLHSLAVYVTGARASQHRTDYDTAMAQRALREYGYER